MISFGNIQRGCVELGFSLNSLENLVDWIHIMNLLLHNVVLYSSLSFSQNYFSWLLLTDVVLTHGHPNS